MRLFFSYMVWRTIWKINNNVGEVDPEMQAK